MSRVEEIEAAIQSLSSDEFRTLMERLRESDQRLWDEQLDADNASGDLDWLFDEAEAERNLGGLRKWPSGD